MEHKSMTKEIIETVIYDEEKLIALLISELYSDGEPKRSGLVDRNMSGPIDLCFDCRICGLHIMECPGHPANS